MSSSNSSSTSQKATNSGIQRLSNGSSVIPSSTRADGSVRKEIKVKPGYKPPEDVELYRNRAAGAWKNRAKSGVPGAESLQKENDESPASALSAAANKNAKRREARKKAAGQPKDGEEEDAVEGGSKADKDTPVQDDKPKPEEVDPEAEKAKEAKKLAKKLRQARELSDKKEKGDSLLPEQFAKVIKMNELIRQLDGLGFDAEGEKKTDAQTAGDQKTTKG
jgi:partner of Y14 and mago protein